VEGKRKRKIDGKKKSKKLEGNEDGMKGRKRNGREQVLERGTVKYVSEIVN
jgi:hypothetical protein